LKKIIFVILLGLIFSTSMALGLEYTNIIGNLTITNTMENITIINSTIQNLEIINVTSNITIINTTIEKLLINQSNILILNGTNTTIGNATINNSEIALRINIDNLTIENSELSYEISNVNITTFTILNSNVTATNMYMENMYLKDSSINFENLTSNKVVIENSRLNANIININDLDVDSSIINLTQIQCNNTINMNSSELNINKISSNNLYIYYSNGQIQSVSNSLTYIESSNITFDSITSNSITILDANVNLGQLIGSSQIAINSSEIYIDEISSNNLYFYDVSGQVQNISSSLVSINMTDIVFSNIIVDNIKVINSKLVSLSGRLSITTSITMEDSELYLANIISSYVSTLNIKRTNLEFVNIDIPSVDNIVLENNSGRVELSINKEYTIDVFNGNINILVGNPTIKNLTGNLTSETTFALTDSSVGTLILRNMVGDITISNSNISEFKINNVNNANIYGDNVNISKLYVSYSSISVDSINPQEIINLDHSDVTFKTDLQDTNINATGSTINTQDVINVNITGSSSSVTFNTISYSSIDIDSVNGDNLYYSDLRATQCDINTIRYSTINCTNGSLDYIYNSNITANVIDSVGIYDSNIRSGNISVSIVENSNLTATELIVSNKIQGSDVNVDVLKGNGITIDDSSIVVESETGIFNVNGTIANSTIIASVSKFISNISEIGNTTLNASIVSKSSFDISGGNNVLNGVLYGNVSNAIVDINGNGEIDLYNVSGQLTFRGTLSIKNSNINEFYVTNSVVKMSNTIISAGEVVSSKLGGYNNIINIKRLYNSDLNDSGSYLYVDEIYYGNIVMNNTNITTSLMNSVSGNFNNSYLNVSEIKFSIVNLYNTTVISHTILETRISTNSSNVSATNINSVTFNLLRDSFINASTIYGSLVPDIVGSTILCNIMNATKIDGNIVDSSINIENLIYSLLKSNYVYNSQILVGFIAYSDVDIKRTYSQLSLSNLIYNNLSIMYPEVNNIILNVSSTNITLDSIIRKYLKLSVLDNTSIIFENSENINNETISLLVKYIQNSVINIVNNSNMEIVIGKFNNINITALNLSNVVIRLENGTYVTFNISHSSNVNIYYYNVTHKTFNIDESNSNVSTIFVPMPIPKLYMIQFDTSIKTTNNTQYMKFLFDTGLISAFITNDESMNLYGILNENVSGVMSSIVFIIPYNITYGVSDIASYKFNETSKSQLILLEGNTMTIMGYTDNGFIWSKLKYGYGDIEPYITTLIIRVLSEKRFNNFFVPVYSDSDVMTFNLFIDYKTGTIRTYQHNNNSIIVPLTNYFIKVTSEKTMTHGGNDFMVRIYDMSNRLLYNFFFGESIDENVSLTQFVPYGNTLITIDVPTLMSDRFVIRLIKINAENGNVESIRKFLIGSYLDNIVVYPQRVIKYDHYIDYQLIVTNYTHSQFMHIIVDLDTLDIETITTFYTILDENIIISYANIVGTNAEIVGINSEGYFVSIGDQDLLPNIGIYYTQVSFTELS